MSSCCTFSLLVLLYSLHVACVTAAEDLVWIGSVTATSFTIHVDVAKQFSAVLLSTTSDFKQVVAQFDPDDAVSIVGDIKIYGRLRKFGFSNLTPSTVYYVGLQDSTADSVQSLTSVRTFPVSGQSTDVTFAFASCLYFQSWSNAFEDIERMYKDHIFRRPEVPFLLLHTGDLVYADIAENEPALFEKSIRSVVTHPKINPVFRAIPVIYMYDDHDYGPNDSDFDSPSREAAISNYRTMVPTYSLPSSDASYFVFTVGRIRVIVTDLLSSSAKDRDSNLGLEQRAWFFDQLKNASSYDLVIWLSTKPWIGSSKTRVDGWFGYPEERTLISNYLVDNNIDNLVMVAGDAHMIAADNGSHSDYSTDGGAGFPVFQSAPFGNVGSSKGGPYSEGCHAYRFFRNEQFAMLHVTAESSNEAGETNNVCVEYEGYVAKKEEPLIKWKKCGKIGGIKGEGGDGTGCSIPWWPGWMWFVLALVLLWIIVLCCNCVLCIRVHRNRRKRKHNGDIGDTES